MSNSLNNAYRMSTGPTIELGGIMIEEQLLADAPVNLALKTLNRHGLIAGATGSGKTRTIQVLAEQLSLAGVPSLVMDIKGDISGLAASGEMNEKLLARNRSLSLDFVPRAFATELYTLEEQPHGIPLRSSIDDFGSLLFSRLLDANETQTGVIAIVFLFAEEENIPLITLADFITLLQYLQTETGRKAIEARYGTIASASIGAIFRKIIELKSQGGAYLFGEPVFNIQDFIQTSSNGEGLISILRLMNLQETPQLFSTFMLKLLSDLYKTLPEIGDPEKPLFVVVIDEAHLIFANASKALLNLLTTMVKLIRSKGVGILFCTQSPEDIPSPILSQLGLKIQHVLRAFTAKDRQIMHQVAKNFPDTTHYDVEQLLTSLRTGEAIVCALGENGQPMPLVKAMIRAPLSRMGTLSDAEVTQLMSKSSLYKNYASRRPSTTAAAVLATKMPAPEKPAAKAPKKYSPAADNVLETLSKNTLVRQVVRQIARSIMQRIMKFFSAKKRG